MGEEESHRPDAPTPTPLEVLQVMASQQAMVSPVLRHVELYTMRGLLSIHWHEPVGAARDAAVVMCGGAMGGVLGPGDSLFHVLGEKLCERGIPSLRIGWRKPNDMDACCIDMAAAVQLAVGSGAERVVTMGHSFGGAVAIRVAVGLPEMVAGGLQGRPLLMFHGDSDSILPAEASEVVRAIAGSGDLRIMPGDDHLLARSHDTMLEGTLEWLDTVFGPA